VGEGRDQVAVSVWREDSTAWGDSIHSGVEATGWSAEVDDQFLVWGHAVRNRLEADAERVRDNALELASAALVSNALG
jgi:hypothetical protein